MDINLPLEKVNIGEQVSLDQIDEQATPTNNLLAAAAKKEKTSQGLKSFGEGMSKAAQGIREGGYEYDFLGDEDEDSIYG